MTGGSIEGDVSWRKPILFGEAFGLTSLSVAWFMTFLPKKRVRGWLLLGSLGVANFIEVFWVSLQQWRGVPSHFNFSTPFDAALFNANGVMIGFTVTVITIVAIWTLFSLQAPLSLAWAIRASMVLLVVAQIFGILILLNGIPKAIDFQTGEFIRGGTSALSGKFTPLLRASFRRQLCCATSKDSRHSCVARLTDDENPSRINPANFPDSTLGPPTFLVRRAT